MLSSTTDVTHALLFVWVLHFQLRCCLYFRVSFTFLVEVLLLLFVWVLPFQCDSACDLYSPYCDFKLMWSLRFECISISCCYAARILTCKAGVATAIVLYRSRFRNGSVWVLQRKWLLFQIGCLVMDLKERPCTSKSRDRFSEGQRALLF